jgi:asparagine synthase (glutamine-hydrolysing)
VRDALLESVRAHLVADVPVGAFLSAGIDSGALVGLMKDAGQQEIRTVTLAFEEFRGTEDDESVLAQQVAAHYGTSHTTRYVSRQEFETDLPLIIDAMDQPSIDGINTWFVSKAAKEQGLKVAISGLGGDELFGGYPSFQDLPRWVKLFRVPSRIPALGRIVSAFGSSLITSHQSLVTVSPKAWGMLEYGGTYPGAYLLRRGIFMPREIADIIGRDLAREGLERLQPERHIASMIDPEPSSAFGRVATLEASLYMRNQLLRDTDWASMAHSLEVRVPLVDSVLLSRLAALAVRSSRSPGKAWLGAAVGRPLPPAVTTRAKTGFRTPVHQWMAAGPKPTSSDPSTASRRTEHWSRSWARRVMGAASNETLGVSAA